MACLQIGPFTFLTILEINKDLSHGSFRRIYFLLMS